MSTRIYASDASISAAGVVYSDDASTVLPVLILYFCDARVMSGWYAIPSGDMPCISGVRTPSASSTWPHLIDCFLLRLTDRYVTCWNRLEWKEALSHTWKQQVRGCHINVLELETLVLAIHHMAKSSRTRGRRVLVFVDSTVTLGAIAKGRSSSRRLNRPGRRAAADLLTSQNDPLLQWVPTAYQPSDATSRHLLRAPHGDRPLGNT